MSVLPRRLPLAALGALALTLQPLAAQEPMTVTADIVGLEGQSYGTVTLTAAPVGVLVRAELTGLEPGVRAMHIHETGACEPPFESAGGHFNPVASPHGYFTTGGPHAGDLPNIDVPDSGAVVVEAFSPLLRLAPDSEATVLDDDGSAFVIHSAADDYESQPSGAAGDRIACAVISR